ncbi:hypothetical protein HAX54_010056 [Datura stramonium]|uniref:Uncharacterized protein n=1 Tax=Datura stramonium TaxID=4076 RepID=A0ABS8TIC8_DATST|nr:hypothetical protein [Datura stramonium]
MSTIFTTELIIDCGVFPCLDVIDAGLISVLVNLIHNQEIDLAIKYVVISVVSDVFANGTDEQIKVSVVEEKCIEPLC